MKRMKSFQTTKLLYLVATPIGNLSEVSERTISILKEMDYIAAEDTRNTLKLLSCLGIKKPLFSLREHNEVEASNHLIELINSGKKVAYVSDAGYPSISDPGYILVKAAINNDIAVSTISGPSAFLNSLVASGLSTDHFYFHGFLSAKDGEALETLNALKNKEETMIFYESPHRLFKTLNLMLSALGDRDIVLARELTKINEEYIRGKISEILKEENDLKGEFVIIVSGNTNKQEIDEKEILNKVDKLVSLGLTKKSAIEFISEEFNINKNYLKKILMK